MEIFVEYQKAIVFVDVRVDRMLVVAVAGDLSSVIGAEFEIVDLADGRQKRNYFT